MKTLPHETLKDTVHSAQSMPGTWSYLPSSSAPFGGRGWGLQNSKIRLPDLQDVVASVGARGAVTQSQQRPQQVLGQLSLFGPEQPAMLLKADHVQILQPLSFLHRWMTRSTTYISSQREALLPPLSSRSPHGLIAGHSPLVLSCTHQASVN